MGRKGRGEDTISVDNKSGHRFVTNERNWLVRFALAKLCYRICSSGRYRSLIQQSDFFSFPEENSHGERQDRNERSSKRALRTVHSPLVYL